VRRGQARSRVPFVAGRDWAMLNGSPMLNVSIPRRYARALIEASSESKTSLDAVRDQLQGLAELFESVPELKQIAIDPSYSRAEKLATVEAVLRLAAVEPLVANLMRLLVERNRLPYLADIARLFRDQADMLMGRVRGQLVTAVPLDPETIEKLQASLVRLTGRKVVLQTKVDPSIIGGVLAQVGTLVYDGSLKSNLEAMRTLMKQG
jgi:F-type H+-transporting ATPase subunit delta